jgi:hemerythrin-like metal-binding protein
MPNNRAALRTGIPLIDRQHAAYFRRADGFLELAGRRTVGRHTLQSGAVAAFNYAAEHFDAEEYLMRSVKYPAYGEHVAKHNIFRSEVRTLTSNLQGNAATDVCAARLSQWLVEWMGEQIQSDDKKLAAFIKQRSDQESRRHAVGALT